jgi:hypothetical protein
MAVDVVDHAPSHLGCWEGYLADVVFGTKTEDTPYLVHRCTPVDSKELQLTLVFLRCSCAGLTSARCPEAKSYLIVYLRT